MSFTESVSAVFSPDSWLAGIDAQFRARPGQQKMALAVAETIEQGGALVVEAGTGVGKTYAYLVPALLSGERIVLSTATKALQDQLFARDLPHLVKGMALPIKTALLKGRASYLCLHRLELARHGPDSASGVGIAHILAKVELWAQGTRSGDLAELTGLDERSPVIPLITSTRENCVGTACPRFTDCHVNLARRQAMAADVVVVNHHLFFADLAVRESGVAELLPSARVVVFDEAHQLNEIGVQFLGKQLSTGQLLDFGRNCEVLGLKQARGLAPWLELSAQLQTSIFSWAAAAETEKEEDVASAAKPLWIGAAPPGVAASAWAAGLQSASSSLQAFLAALDLLSELGPDFVKMHERGSFLLEALQSFAQPCAEDKVRWIDKGQHLRLVESPLDIAKGMRERVLGESLAERESESDPSTLAEEMDSQTPARKAWIFTSATLGTDEKLSWFTQACGLEHARVLRVESPFDYAAQASLYVPAELPKPADPTHSRALAVWVGRASLELGGRTLVLTTTTKALNQIGEALQNRFVGSDAIEVLVQGQWPKRRLMERFRLGSDSDSGRPGCILVASASFWEGFDVPGNALQLVVIDKLPFPPPSDPLVQARCERLEAQGRSPFQVYSVPEAAMALKQGAGRLIRHEDDSGILVVADTRLSTMGYGKKLIAALPPMRRLTSEAEFQQALAALTKASTMDYSWL